VEAPRDDGTAVSLVRNSIRLSATVARFELAPPALGGPITETEL
jgi:hypothetical protein